MSTLRQPARGRFPGAPEACLHRGEALRPARAPRGCRKGAGSGSSVSESLFSFQDGDKDTNLLGSVVRMDLDNYAAINLNSTPLSTIAKLRLSIYQR